jgi:hypothetical protein
MNRQGNQTPKPAQSIMSFGQIEKVKFSVDEFKMDHLDKVFINLVKVV